MTKEITKLNPMTMISTALENKTPVSEMTQLFELQKSWEANEAKKAYSVAMSLCQSEMPLIVRNAENNQTSSTYAKHELICKLVKPVYTKHGLSLSFHEGKADKEGDIRTICDVEHALGFMKQFYVDFAIDDKGIKGTTNKTQIHGKASTFSYARRYLTMMVFDLATYDDNDGNVAPRLSVEQVKEIKDLITNNDLNLQAFLKYAKAGTVESIAATAYQWCIDNIEATINNKKKKS
jgi:hypothetical protein